jgi:hypothetical protein
LMSGPTQSGYRQNNDATSITRSGFVCSIGLTDERKTTRRENE